jgi:hypothetical protein
MHPFNFAGLQDKLRQLFAMAIVVASDDMVDDFGIGCGTPVFLYRLFRQSGQLGFDSRDVQLLTRCGAFQRLFAAAAVVHIVFTEQRGGARNRQCQLA